MKVSEAMTRDVRVANPNETIRDAARMMAEINAGSLPVGENDRLVGVITDRDIAVRAVAEGKAPTTKVRDVMSPEVLYCYDDQDLDDVAKPVAAYCGGGAKTERWGTATVVAACDRDERRARSRARRVRAAGSRFHRAFAQAIRRAKSATQGGSFPVRDVDARVLHQSRRKTSRQATPCGARARQG